MNRSASYWKPRSDGRPSFGCAGGAAKISPALVRRANTGLIDYPYWIFSVFEFALIRAIRVKVFPAEAVRVFGVVRGLRHVRVVFTQSNRVCCGR
jgi:hypothetical protein